jgi:hypothetical protein
VTHAYCMKPKRCLKYGCPSKSPNYVLKPVASDLFQSCLYCLRHYSPAHSLKIGFVLYSYFPSPFPSPTLHSHTLGLYSDSLRFYLSCIVPMHVSIHSLLLSLLCPPPSLHSFEPILSILFFLLHSSLAVISIFGFINLWSAPFFIKVHKCFFLR